MNGAFCSIECVGNERYSKTPTRLSPQTLLSITHRTAVVMFMCGIYFSGMAWESCTTKRAFFVHLDVLCWLCIYQHSNASWYFAALVHGPFEEQASDFPLFPCRWNRLIQILSSTCENNFIDVSWMRIQNHVISGHTVWWHSIPCNIASSSGV